MRRIVLMAWALVAVAAMHAGCADARTRWERLWPKPLKDVLTTAIEADHPDVRREAIVSLARHPQRHHPLVWRTLDVVARSDESAMVRCAALRTLARLKEPHGAATAVAVLQSTPPAADSDAQVVRWDALELLRMLSESGRIAEPDRDVVAHALIEALRDSRTQQERMSAARALRHYRRPEVLAALVDALRLPDFGVQYEAEASLIALTGHTHGYDADAWERWLGQTEDPFAHAGRTPPSLRRPTWWQRAREVLLSGWNRPRGRSEPGDPPRERDRERTPQRGRDGSEDDSADPG